MTSEELVTVLRYCANGSGEFCQSCKLRGYIHCYDVLTAAAADVIEGLTKEGGEIITMKRYKITHKVGDKKFFATAETIAEAYEYVDAIIQSNPLNFPNPGKALSGWMEALVDIGRGRALKPESSIFAVELVDSTE